MKQELVIDPEFQSLTVPATKEEQAALEKSLLEEGCIEPIFVWNNTIVDGHKRYVFCSFEEIDFDVRELYFKSRNEAISWVCRKRLGDLAPGTVIYKFLMGKWYRSLRPKYNEMMRNGVISDPPLDSRGRRWTSKLIADDCGVSYSAVENGEAYARNMERIAISDPEIFKALISGEIKATINEVRFLAQNNRRTRSIIRSRLYPEPMRERVSRKPKEEKGVPLSTGIKEMPAFDPDMEIRGLTLTIPTWMASIARAEQKTDMNLATDHAKKQLAESLLRLEAQIEKTLEALVCMEKEF